MLLRCHRQYYARTIKIQCLIPGGGKAQVQPHPSPTDQLPAVEVPSLGTHLVTEQNDHCLFGYDPMLFLSCSSGERGEPTEAGSPVLHQDTAPPS